MGARPLSSTAPALDWREIDGWFSDDDQRVYESLVRRYDSGRMVEVGCWKGRSLASVLPLCRELGYAYVGAVDTWEGSPSERDTYHAEARTVDVSAVFEHELRRRGLLDLVDVRIEQSLRAVSRYPDGSLDLVFLDADHDATAVTADVLAWLPKVSAGGTLAGHDIGWQSVREGLEAAGVEWALGDPAGRSSIWVVSV